MEYKDGLIQGFELKFRTISEDSERYLFALADLLDEGKIEKVPGKSLYDTHYRQGFSWIIDCYFEAARFDALEAYFTPSGEVFFGPIYEGEIEYLERMLELGEAARVRRVWRAHIGHLKSTYWFYINERKKGFRHEPLIMNVSEKEQHQDHERFVGRIPELKKTLLSVMADYRALCVRSGAAQNEIARIDADIAAVEAEARPKPSGKRDNRPMTEDVFWELIDEGLGVQPLGERLDSLPERLALFKPSAIRKFDQILRQMDAAAYRTDVWALAYLLQGGCSDDSFDAFRGWLILQGRAVFEAALDDPDGFDVALHQGGSGGMDALRDVAPLAYDLREGKAMKPVKAPLLELSGPEIDEPDFPARLPRIAEAVEWDA